ncbi:MAG: hypothetical protein JW909_09330 [Planctomycetes bacterium]|nr:hypothetical protein [Planctomycetota bacterium]
MTLRGAVCAVTAILLFSRIAAAEAPSVPSPYDRTFKAAPVVIVGTAVALDAKGSVRLRVTMPLKGMGLLPGAEVSVDVSAAPVGTWPSLGMQVVAGVEHVSENNYRLTARFGSLLPAEQSVIQAVRKLLAEQPSAPSDTPLPDAAPAVDSPLPAEQGDIGPRGPVSPAVVHVTDSLETQALAAEMIAVGRVVEVRFSTEKGVRAILRFSVETRLFGGGVPDLIEVHVPAPDVNYTGEPPSFRTGRYCLFMTSRKSGGGLDMVSPYFGAYYLEDDTQEALLKQKIFATPVMRQRKLSAPILTTLQATIGVWQASWNEKNLARLITCYSRKSVFHRLYAAGGSHRMALDRKLREFPGTVAVRIVGVSDRTEAEAKVAVELLLEVSGASEQRPAVMRFVKEEGEWRILEEGF